MDRFIAKITHYFADNHPLTIMVFIGLVLFGVVAFLAMPKQYNPEIVRPAFVISITYDGATNDEMMRRIGYDLVEQLQVIPGIDDIFIEAHDGGQLFATTIFKVGEDTAMAKADILTRLEGGKAMATGAVSSVNVQEINPETIPVVQAVFSSTDRTVYDVRQAVLDMRPSLLAVPGVSELTVAGGDAMALVVSVDPQALADAGVSITTLTSVLADADLRIVSSGFEGDQYTIGATIEHSADTATAVGLLPLTTNVRVRDVAEVYAGGSSRHGYTLYAGSDGLPHEVVMLGVAKRAGTNAPTVTRAVAAELDAYLAQPEFNDISYKIVHDDGAVAGREINGLTFNLLTSILIVAAILLLFLSARAAAVVLITVPLTFFAVLGIGFVAGETINRITLFALILSLGLLVDASIVVVDIVYEHLERAHHQMREVSRARVAAEAVHEVGAGLVLSTITSVVVFLPMFYITGMMGPYMGPIAFFVPVALIAALGIAITITPFVAVYLLRVGEKPNAVSAVCRRALEWLTHNYLQILRRIIQSAQIRRVLLWSAGGLFAVAILLPLSGFVHFQMLPKADRDQLYVYIDVSAGNSREQTEVFTNSVVQVLAADQMVTSQQVFIARQPLVDFNGLFKGAANRVAAYQATIRVNLVASTDRKESSTDVTTRLRAATVAALGEAATQVRFMEEPPGPPVQATFVAKISGTPADQAAVAQSLQSLLATVPGAVDVYTSYTAPVSSVRYVLDDQAIAAAGVSTADATTWFSVLTGPLQIAEVVNDTPERIPLLVSVPAELRSSPSGMQQVSLPNQTGHVVSAADVTTQTYEVQKQVQYFEGALPIAYVTAEVEGRSIVYVMIDTIHHLVSGQLPGYTVSSWGLFGMTLTNDTGEEISIEWGGEWEMTLENFRDLGIAMLVALVMVYMVLVAQYRSFSTPGLVLLTVPLGLIGILFGFTLLDHGFGIYLTATALIGFIALIGIVVNNAIIFLEYVEQALADGVSYEEALLAAGALRLRPILLTSLTTVLGSLTIASDPVWSGLAWSIVFGLSLSTVLTLIILPAFLVSVKK